MRKNTWACAVVVLFLASVAAFADETTAGVKGRLWIADFDGEIKSDDRGIVGNTIDLGSDLDLNGKDEFGEGEAYFHLSRNDRINLHFWGASFNGRKDITETLTFAGSSYSIGTRVKTSIGLQVGTLTYERILFSQKSENVAFQFGIQAGVKYIAADAEMRAPLAIPVISEKEDFEAPIPVVGARAKFDITEWVSLEASVNGFSISNIRDIDATIIEAVGEAQVNIFKGVYTAAGYHLFQVDVDAETHSNEKFKVDTTMGGFFFAIGYRF